VAKKRANIEVIQKYKALQTIALKESPTEVFHRGSEFEARLSKEREQSLITSKLIEKL
jgi:hypothetical protein